MMIEAHEVIGGMGRAKAEHAKRQAEKAEQLGDTEYVIQVGRFSVVGGDVTVRTRGDLPSHLFFWTRDRHGWTHLPLDPGEARRIAVALNQAALRVERQQAGLSNDPGRTAR